MKKLLTLILLLCATHLFAAGDDPMVILYQNEWDFTTFIPITGIVPDGSVYIDWGDGTDTTIYEIGGAGHSFTTTGSDTVKVSGAVTRFGKYEEKMLGTTRPTSVISWGDLPLQSLHYAFCYVYNLVSVPPTVPSSVVDMSNMFYGSNFYGDLSGWDVSNVRNMSYMLYDVSYFHSDISGWDVSSVTNMSHMFDCCSFNGDISGWDVSNVTNMSHMFSWNSINCDLGSWDVSSVTNMASMFSNAGGFNCDLSSWDVSNVTNVNNMFSGASFFNGDVSRWDVSNVTNMIHMFSRAIAFNGDLSDWDVSSVTNMAGMFDHAVEFNCDLSSWDVSNVTNVNNMFYHAQSFNSDISDWDIANVNNMFRMLDSTALSVTNYDLLLKKWSGQSIQKNVSLGVRGLLYTDDAVEARNKLINDYGWTIEGDSLVETIYTVTYDENYPGGTTFNTEKFSPVSVSASPSYFPKREGYKLVGWNSKPDGSGYAFDTSTVIIDDITFYAQWEKLETAIIQTDTTTLTGVKGLLVSPNPVPQSAEKVTLVIPSDLSGFWEISICDVLGNELDGGAFEAQGGTAYEWDLCNKAGAKVAGGSYVIRAIHTDKKGREKSFKRKIGVAQ